MTDGTDIPCYNYAAYDLAAKAGWVRDAPGAGAVADAARTLPKIAALFDESAELLCTEMRKLNVRWRGSAATTASASMNRTAQWAAAVSAAQRAGGRQVDAYGRSFATASRQIQDVPKPAWWQAALGVLVDYDEKVSAYHEADQRANHALFTHEQNTRAALVAFPDPSAMHGQPGSGSGPTANKPSGRPGGTPGRGQGTKPAGPTPGRPGAGGDLSGPDAPGDASEAPTRLGVPAPKYPAPTSDVPVGTHNAGFTPLEPPQTLPTSGNPSIPPLASPPTAMPPPLAEPSAIRPGGYVGRHGAAPPLAPRGSGAPPGSGHPVGPASEAAQLGSSRGANVMGIPPPMTGGFGARDDRHRDNHKRVFIPSDEPFAIPHSPEVIPAVIGPDFGEEEPL